MLLPVTRTEVQLKEPLFSDPNPMSPSCCFSPLTVEKCWGGVTSQAAVISRVLWSLTSAGSWMLSICPPSVFTDWPCPLFHNYFKSFLSPGFSFLSVSTGEFSSSLDTPQFYFHDKIEILHVLQYCLQTYLWGVHSSHPVWLRRHNFYLKLTLPYALWLLSLLPWFRKFNLEFQRSIFFNYSVNLAHSTLLAAAAVCTHVCLWGSGVNMDCPPQSPFILFFETGSFWTWNLPGSPQNLTPSSYTLKLPAYSTGQGLLCGRGGSELRFSCLPDKLFDQAVSPAPRSLLLSALHHHFYIRISIIVTETRMCKNRFQRQESRFSVSAGFELKVFLPQPPRYWEDRCVPVCRHTLF